MKYPMITKTATVLSLAFASLTSQAADTDSNVEAVNKATCPAFLDHNITRLNSSKQTAICEQYAGKTFLIVNTASNCGFTPQFEGLEALYQKYKDRGLVILGFPSDDFFQEEDDEKDTAKVCFVNYGVTFPMFTTVEVRGDGAHPIFAHLGEKTASPYWNFYKYLVSANGKTIERFNSKTNPDSKELIQAIEKQLGSSI
nr:glutathione peroxidase [Thalassotalea sp. HSM 43]